MGRMELNEQEQVLQEKDPGFLQEEEKTFPPGKEGSLSFLQVLNEHKLPYCLDSGVLLGLMREGQLLNHEKDIDLQMWADDEEQLFRLLPFFWAAGYTVTIWLYKGLVCQYRFLKEQNLPVHIMLFRRYGSQAWCPAGEGAGPPFPSLLTRRFYHYFVVARKHFRERLIVTDVSRWPWKVRRNCGTWWVPGKFFEKTVYHPLFETYIPEKWEEYLAFRYGNWRVPAQKWKIWLDDSTLRHELPEKMVDLSAYKTWEKAKKLKEIRKKSGGN